MEECLRDDPPGDPHDPQNPQRLYSLLERGISDIHENRKVELPATDHTNLRLVVSALIKHHDRTQDALSHYYPEADQRMTPYCYPSPCRNIYDNLHDYLADYLKTIAQNILSHDLNTLLDAYLDAWELFNEAATRVDTILNQVNAWVEFHMSKGIRELYYVHTLHCVQWQEHVWGKVCHLVVDGMQKAMQQNYEYADDMRRFMDRFASWNVGRNWDERARIYQCLEAPFTSMIKAHHKRVNNFIDRKN